MTVFEYSTSILSIVIGLAVAHLLSGVIAPLRFGTRVQGYPVFTLWCLTMILVSVGAWFGVWSTLREQARLGFFTFMIAFSGSAIVYAAARVLVPDFSQESLPELVDHFETVRRPFFACLALIFGAGASIALLGVTTSVESPRLEIALALLLAGLAGAGGLVASARFHTLLAIVWPLIYLAQQSLQPAIASG